MPVITIVFLGVFMAIVAVIAAILAVAAKQCERAKQLERQQFLPHVSDFSVSQYMERMEAAGLEIMREKRERQKYQIVLWAGLDGLRLNDDGTAEWIKRENDKPKPISVSYSPRQSIAPGVMQFPYSLYGPCQN